MAKRIVDYILDSDYPRYKELVAKAQANKAAAPKPERKPRQPMTDEARIAALEKRIAAKMAKVNALLGKTDDSTAEANN